MTADLLPQWLWPCWQQLARYRQQQKIPHGLMIESRAGMGKRLLARRFAQSLLCPELAENDGNEPCGVCSSCQLFLSGTHPDYLELMPESAGKAITIDQIRALSAKLALKPLYQQMRIAVISPAERMNMAAYNALLKTLEEPAERTSLILLSDASARIPATIASRCQKIMLQEPTPEQAAGWLAEKLQHDCAPDVALAAAGGAPLTAVDMSRTGEVSDYQAVITSFLALLENQKEPEAIAAEWDKLKQPERVIQWVMLLLSDMIRLAIANNRGIVASNINGLEKIAPRISGKKLYSYLDLLTESRRLAQSQVNIQMMYEDLLIRARDTLVSFSA